MASSPPSDKQILVSIETSLGGYITKTDVEFTEVVIYTSGIHNWATKNLKKIPPRKVFSLKLYSEAFP